MILSIQLIFPELSDWYRKGSLHAEPECRNQGSRRGYQTVAVRNQGLYVAYYYQSVQQNEIQRGRWFPEDQMDGFPLDALQLSHASISKFFDSFKCKRILE